MDTQSPIPHSGRRESWAAVESGKKSPRIWRALRTSPDGPVNDPFWEDEALNAARVYSCETLSRIAEEGFTGIWLSCPLYSLMRSDIFPELNDARTGERIAALEALIERGRKHGVGVWLYFNEPAGLATGHPFWKSHPGLRGPEKWGRYALCTSSPLVRDFLRQALHGIFSRLEGIEGVCLITGSEDLTHCWSKVHTRLDGHLPPACPRCHGREAADVVVELLEIWAEVRRSMETPFRILAWNWSWNYWYEEPEAEIVKRLPRGVELLLDFEFGGIRQWKDRMIEVGEYSLGYVGPCRRFVAAQSAIEARGTPIHAKIEFNVTHELCSVPNLPVLATIHGKFRAMLEYHISGFLGCWTMGTRFTLNTHALKLFLRNPEKYSDAETFLDALAREYFGFQTTPEAIEAWTIFSEAMKEYPFSVRILYTGPHNDAPARPLSLHYQGLPMKASFRKYEYGDDLQTCIDGFTLDEVIEGFSSVCERWEVGLRSYEAAFERNGRASCNETQATHRREELGCARMIDIQFRSIANAFRFFREQQRVMTAARLTAPCLLPRDEALVAIMKEEIENVRNAISLVEADPRLGFHQDTQGHKYNAAMILRKIGEMNAELD